MHQTWPLAPEGMMISTIFLFLVGVAPVTLFPLQTTYILAVYQYHNMPILVLDKGMQNGQAECVQILPRPPRPSQAVRGHTFKSCMSIHLLDKLSRAAQ